MSPTHKNMCRLCVFIIQLTLQPTLRKNTMDSFASTGMYPLNITGILQECPAERSPEEGEKVVSY
jgi:hypothetical protein